MRYSLTNSPTFQSKVRLDYDTYCKLESVYTQANIRNKFSRQIKRLERNGNNDIVDIFCNNEKHYNNNFLAVMNIIEQIGDKYLLKHYQRNISPKITLDTMYKMAKKSVPTEVMNGFI